ncbi:MAG: hypothetical protein Kow00128_20970 [Deltaproteobacteria bacterium]
MRRAKAQIAIVGSLFLLAALLAGCGTSGREGQIGVGGQGAAPVQKGDPEIPPASGYAGSQTCSTCHPGQFLGWSKSLHNAPLKTVAELGDKIFVNDADGNGTNDFKDGLDLSTNPNFSIFGTNAPILSYAGGKYFITIGAVSYEVQRTQGGNGLWKQRYHTKIGRSYYILPVQYNEKTKEYVQYNANRWYDGSNLPRYTAAYGTDALVAQFDAARGAGFGTLQSWEINCAGCHQTGLVVKAETTNYGGTDVEEAVSGYSELNIGCESCHGPGAAHAASRNPADIINPDNFQALGVTGLRLADQVCGACHSRGHGSGMLLGKDTEYPSRDDGFGGIQLPLPGESVVDNSAGTPYVVLKYPPNSAYWDINPAPLGQTKADKTSWYNNWYNGFGWTYNFPTYTASKQHHQQWTDLEQGPHSADKAASDQVTCFSCHDPHLGSGEHQVRETVVEDGLTIKTENDNDTLCLSCHSEGDPFTGITKADVQAYGNGATVDEVAEWVTGHTQHSFAPSASGNNAASRCSGCHMPKTAKSAINNDIHNHTFLIIEPEVSMTTGDAPGVRNSCEPCHVAGDTRIDPTGTLTGDAFLAALQEKFEAELQAPNNGAATLDGVADASYGPPLTMPLAEGIDNTDAAGNVVGCVQCHSLAGSTETVTLRATHDGTNLYIFAQWNDNTASFTRGGAWIFNPVDNTFSTIGGQSEDRIAFYWPIGSPTGDVYGGNCMKKCHTTDVHPGEGLEDEAYLATGTADMWHGKGARYWPALGATGTGLTVDPATSQVTAGVVTMDGYMDDKNIGPWSAGNAPDGGRYGDSGSGAESRNRNAAKTGPLYIETNPTDFMDAMTLTQAEVTGGQTIVADPDDPAFNPAAVAAAWANYVALNAVIPERILKTPAGSRADLRSFARWENGVWTIEIMRALDTGNTDDVAFAAGGNKYKFGVAVMDNGGGDVHKVTRKIKLVVQ